MRHKRSGNWSWLWHCGSRKGTHSFWTLTLSTCHWIRGRASAGSSTCRPTNWLQLLPPLTTAVGEKWGGVLVIIYMVWKMGRADTWRGLDNLSVYSLFLTLTLTLIYFCNFYFYDVSCNFCFISALLIWTLSLVFFWVWLKNYWLCLSFPRTSF